MNFKRLLVSDIKIDIKMVPKKKELLAAMVADDVNKKFGEQLSRLTALMSSLIGLQCGCQRDNRICVNNVVIGWASRIKKL
ncbi:hypothetical protein PRUPE_1G161900 [Prunus persica]|uniref:Uncharacterized protein n=1 Tax=Prunus persica TaxID=3760 RepID=M5XSV3_PRUPE|nr:hypothetical protein PRUPE_1G161900 [Prunus persica]